MIRPAFLAFCVGIAMIAPGAAQEAPAYTPEDAKILAACYEAASTRMAEGLDADPKACIGQAAQACTSTPEGATTPGISDCLARETGWWDEQLNARYAQLRETLDTESFSALQDAQRQWLTFRERDCEFQYTYWREGTIRSTFYGGCMLEHTGERVLALDQVLSW